ncbi:MAG: HD domain-containing protein [Firmicutes bacterium]|nr:HD domain-containing protein [Bacillota bacterium]
MHKDMVEFVRAAIARNGRPTEPFRDRFTHTLRVLKWAERLQELEGGDLEVIRTAALFHDVGWDPGRPHETVGAEITQDYLTEHGFPAEKVAAVVEAVAHHNHRDSPGPFSKETLILQDADFLDEVGVLTIVWDSMRVALQKEPSYEAAYERARKTFAQLEGWKHWLRTPSGRKLYEEQLGVLGQCLEWLKYELDR